MDLERKSLRIGAVAILCAIAFRLLGSGVIDTAVQALSKPEVASFLLYLETGRVVRPSQLSPEAETTEPVPETTAPAVVQQTVPQEPLVTEEVRAAFSQEDALSVEVNSVCGYEVDVGALLQQQLDWDLMAEEPSVLILHTHGSESYTKTETYVESADYRTLDTQYNVVSIGARLAQLLEAGGIKVVHDVTLHDQPSYNDAYQQSREAVQAYLAQYPSIRLILDIHRDAAEDSSGQQVAKTVSVGGQTAAQLMLVVGTDAGGLTHPDWKENMALAVKLHAQLEKNCPGICRPISFRTQRFNQDLSAGALLIEVGTAGNTRQEALLAVERLAQGILDLAKGTAEPVITVDSTS